MITIVLTNRVMTAQPLFETMRGVIGERIRYWEISNEKKDSLFNIVRQIDREYQELVKTRNKLLHGTWWPNHTEGALRIEKFKGTLDGIGVVDVPTSPRELIRLARRCRQQASLIFGLAPTVTTQPEFFDPGNAFKYEGGKWKPRERISLGG